MFLNKVAGLWSTALKQFFGNRRTPQVAPVLKLDTISNTRDKVIKLQKIKKKLIESFISSAVSKKKK